VDTNVSLDKVQYELSAGRHDESLNVLTNVRKGFKRKNIYPRGLRKRKGMGGVDTNVTTVEGEVIVSVE
jgi:hypothetical protein